MKENKKIPKWLIIVGAVLLLLIIGAVLSDNETIEIEKNVSSNTTATVAVIDFSSMTQAQIKEWCENNNINCSFSQEYSNTVTKDKFISQSVAAEKVIKENSSIVIKYSLGREPSKEFQNALKKAQTYSDMMHMSKRGIYDQLTSEYGEGFEKDAAQYAIENVKADWNKNALEKAKTYRDTMSMSKSAIYEQLISEYGEQFTKDQAQYAVDHLDD